MAYAPFAPESLGLRVYAPQTLARSRVPLGVRAFAGLGSRFAIPVLAATTLALGGGAGCADIEGRPPVARIDATPRAIPEHDDFQTAVVLDASRSADPIDDPDGGLPLRYAWELTNDEFRLEPGSDLESPTVRLRFRGERPATVRLTVTDTDGQSATARLQMQLTVAR